MNSEEKKNIDVSSVKDGLESGCHQELCMDSYTQILKLKMCVGTIRTARVHERATKPMYVLEVDFGEYGMLTTLAQLTQNYSAEALIGLQISGVLNMPPKRIAGIKSQFLILAATDPSGSVLLAPTKQTVNGSIVR